MNKEIYIKVLVNKYLYPAYILYAICVLTIISTPFIWLWHSWYYAWRILLTSLLVFIFLNAYIYIGSKIIEKVVEEFLKGNPHLIKKTFLQRMEERKNNP